MTTEIVFTLALMAIAGIALFLFILKHSKKIITILAILLILLGFHAGRLGYLQHKLNEAKELIGDIRTETPEVDVSEKVDLPEAEDARKLYYYDNGARGFGLPDADGGEGILNDVAEELFGE